MIKTRQKTWIFSSQRNRKFYQTCQHIFSPCKREYSVWKTNLKAGSPGTFVSRSTGFDLSWIQNSFFFFLIFNSSKLTVSCSCSAKLVLLSSPTATKCSKIDKNVKFAEHPVEVRDRDLLLNCARAGTSQFPSSPALGDRNPPASYKTPQQLRSIGWTLDV